MFSLGIDTSCYTTSLVVMDDSKVIYEGRQLLNVKKGTVGLRQADAFFQHVQNLPKLYRSLTEKFDVSLLNRIVVSNRPRPVDGSYMPVFTAGMSFAEVVALSIGLQVTYLSHQENHLYACLLEHPVKEGFIGVHISGGTSEILSVSNNLDIKIIGDTLDISFGKLIDRLGVYMGFDFPCGKALDLLTSDTIYQMNSSIKEMSFNISGIENKLKSLYDKDSDADKIAVSLFTYISNVLIKVLDKALIETGYKKILMSGGVSANSIIRTKLTDRFNDQILFTSVANATDHAIGNAYYGNVVKTY